MSIDCFVWPTEFSCILILGDAILPTDYSVTIGMVPINSNSTAVGLKKIKQFISKFVQNSILIKQDHEFLPQLDKMNTNTIQLPQDPDDYFFGNVLFHKLNAIVHDHFAIQQITIDSSVGDRVKYKINDYDQSLHVESWWNNDNVSTNNIATFPSWEELDICVSNKFSPKLIRGGKGENKQIQ